QFVFTFRFIIQWFYTEKVEESVLPIGFWIFSIIGSVMVLSYAVIRKDPVLFVGQLFGFVV
ncbi:MAG TPA: lauroyl acyltransferase, partial [Desulfobulbaceae bacterium]|nr:lauroyl acyltransferase [Desulfobulbaceae bacterium]